MRYNALTLLELDKLVEENEDLSMGQIFYSFLRPCFLNGKHLLDATDEEIFTSIENARKREGKDEEMSTEEITEFLNKK